MPAVIRLGDLSTGHGCFAPTPLVKTKVSKTFVNGILPGVIDELCQYEDHCCGPNCHTDVERSPSVGSTKTYFEGSPVARIGDNIACGDACAEGSFNTFIV